MRAMRNFCSTLLLFSALTGSALAESWTGKASYYNYARGHTASGKHFGAQTAAHKYLSFGTHLKVTNLRNGKATTVIIADRGPFTVGRVIDVSAAAAETLAFKENGTALVKIETVAR
jgi:rare lipoprotein A